MRKKIILSAIAIVGCIYAFNSCSKLAQQLAQGITWTGVDETITVPIVNDTAMHTSIGTGSFSYNLDSLIKNKTNNALGLSNVDTFEFTSCTLTILGPDSNNNFQNFQLAQATFSTNANTTAATIGEVDNNPDTYSATLSLPVNNSVNMKSYLNPVGITTFNYTLAGKMRKATTTALTVQAHVSYYIHVKP